MVIRTVTLRIMNQKLNMNIIEDTISLYEGTKVYSCWSVAELLIEFLFGSSVV